MFCDSALIPAECSLECDLSVLWVFAECPLGVLELEGTEEDNDNDQGPGCL